MSAQSPDRVEPPDTEIADVVVVERVAPFVTQVTLNRPRVRNAVDGELTCALEAAVRATEADEAVRAVVLTGSGSVFCAGADLRQLSSQGSTPLRTVAGGFAGFVRQPRTKPWIAAVNGPALAGGFEIALACDIILAVPDAKFGLPEVTRGLVASAGGAFRAARALPRGVAMELVLTGGTLDAARACEVGLVNWVSPRERLLADALALAGRIASAAPLAVRETRALALAAQDLDEDELFARSDAARERIAQTHDYREGPRAFLEKRPPQWVGA